MPSQKSSENCPSSIACENDKQIGGGQCEAPILAGYILRSGSERAGGRGQAVTAHKALGGVLRISKALVKGKALAKGTSKVLA